MIACIPTKGRPKTKTYKLFEDVGIKVFHFIEPQDIESYNVPNKISILENDKGVGYARNFILNYCRNNSIELCIMCDDDIDSFGEVVNGKTIKKGNGCLKFNHIFFNCPPVGTNKGGCYDGYKLRKDTEVINEICNKYVGFVNVVKKPKTYDIRWDFKKWASHHKRQVK